VFAYLLVEILPLAAMAASETVQWPDRNRRIIIVSWGIDFAYGRLPAIDPN